MTKSKPSRAAMAFAILCEMLDVRSLHDEAMRACNRAITLNPRLADAWSSRAKVYRSSCDFDSSIADFTKAIALNPKPIFDFLERANTYKQKGDYERFVPERAETSKTSYDRAIADGIRVEALARELPPEKATLAGVVSNFAGELIDESKQAMGRLGKPLDPRRRCEGGDIAKDMPPALGDGAESITMACTALIRSGRETTAELGEDYFHRARLGEDDSTVIEELSRGQTDVADYEKAISLGVEVPESSLSIGSIYAVEGEGERAIPYLNVAVAAGSHLERALAARAQAHAEAGHYEAAMADVESALKLKPDDPDAFLARSMAYIARGDYDQALADCSAAAQKGEGHYTFIVRAYGICANAHFLKRDYAAAISDYRQAERNAPLTAGMVYARGVAKFRDGDIAGAQADVNQAVGMDSNVIASSAKLGIAP